MAATAPSSDIETQIASWGAWARRTTDRLGYPRTSCISNMVEQVKVFSKRGEGQKVLTARGKQTKVMTAPKIGYVPREIMLVDRIVADLPNRFKKLIYRRYVFQQPDRIAAVQLRMDRDQYTSDANDAVKYISERLAFYV